MKIWIDLTNSPHVNLFENMIREFQKDHKVLLTCRPLANTIELLEMSQFRYFIVGSHYGQKITNKILGFFIRIIQLYWFLRTKEVDVAISHSSFYSPVVSWLLGIRCIYLNDNEYAEGNRISFIFADKIMIPEFLSLEKVKKQWAREEKIIRYPGIKEGIYLWSFQPDNFNNIDGKENKKTVFIRTEPWTAQYYKGGLNFIDELLIKIKDRFRIILLPRGKEQAKHYSQDKFSGVTVPEKSMSLNEIMSKCDLFIGSGGTMTREAAVLGIPTISIYQDELLDVDKYLIDKGCMVYKKDVNAEFVMEFVAQTEIRSPDRQLLLKGREAYELIEETVLKREKNIC